MKKKNINDLLQVMQQLRDPVTGCVWDKQQTYKTILPHTIEEVYEVAEAIETEDFDELPGELGDLLFQIVFYSQIAKEEGRFDFEHVTHAITEKMIRRHPHVFFDEKFDKKFDKKFDEKFDEKFDNKSGEKPDVKVESVEAQSKLWDAIKQQEQNKKEQKNEQKNMTDDSALSGINKHQPPINIATKIQKRAATVGFDWPTLDGPLAKISEEFVEVKEAIASGDEAAMKDELGDLLFAVVNLARHLKISPDEAIALTNKKFESRFREMETLAKNNKQCFSDLSLEEQEKHWVEVKQRNRD